MSLSGVQFQVVSKALSAALANIAQSKRTNDGVVFAAAMAEQDLKAPDRDYSRDPAEVVDPLAYAKLAKHYSDRVNTHTNWFYAINEVWRELEDIRVAFVFERGQFDQVFGSLESDLLDGLAEIFSKFGETLSPSMLTNESGQVYRRVLLNQGNRTFPEIANCCKDLAVRKRSARNN